MFILYGAQVADCSEMNTKQINTVWAECQSLNIKRVGARNQLAVKG